MQLKQYPAERIRNVALVSHGGAGKTSLAEALLFDPDETKRHISVSASVLPLEWCEHKINLLDVPGFADFAGEIRGAIRAVDGAVILIDAAAGVEVGTEQVWKLAGE